MRNLKTGLLVFIGLMLAACSVAPTTSLFPTATEVRVLGSPKSFDVHTDKDGRVTASGTLPNGQATRDSFPVIDGGKLTAREIASLRSAIGFTHPPSSIVGCCLPRHAFLFYDSAGHFVGSLEVCFECGCAHMQPFRPAGPDRSWITWKEDVVKQIVVNHNLTPLPLGPGGPG